MDIQAISDVSAAIAATAIMGIVILSVIVPMVTGLLMPRR